MGEGRDQARAADPNTPHHGVLEDFRDQLLVALLKILANKDGEFTIPVSEVDKTGDSLVSFSVVPGPQGQTFHFQVRKKS